jgi:hypothetical protein
MPTTCRNCCPAYPALTNTTGLQRVSLEELRGAVSPWYTLLLRLQWLMVLTMGSRHCSPGDSANGRMSANPDRFLLDIVGSVHGVDGGV